MIEFINKLNPSFRYALLISSVTVCFIMSLMIMVLGMTSKTNIAMYCSKHSIRKPKKIDKMMGSPCELAKKVLAIKTTRAHE